MVRDFEAGEMCLLACQSGQYRFYAEPLVESVVLKIEALAVESFGVFAHGGDDQANFLLVIFASRAACRVFHHYQGMRPIGGQHIQGIKVIARNKKQFLNCSHESGRWQVGHR